MQITSDVLTNKHPSLNDADVLASQSNRTTIVDIESQVTPAGIFCAAGRGVGAARKRFTSDISSAFLF